MPTTQALSGLLTLVLFIYTVYTLITRAIALLRIVRASYRPNNDKLPCLVVVSIKHVKASEASASSSPTFSLRNMTDSSNPVLIFLFGATVGAASALFLQSHSQSHAQRFERDRVCYQCHESNRDVSRWFVHVHNRNSTDMMVSRDVARGEGRYGRTGVESGGGAAAMPSRWFEQRE
ncbi:hypothetical protein SVAN01_10521 [Stagonosporopsis vannaccii]|nr:hypothetical protein SVAN01_10521 [Stagonosporopsis vannaccii]